MYSGTNRTTKNPADADGDNVYKVTVVTFDGVGSDAGRGEFDVCIAVMNIDEARKDNAAG